MKSADSILSCHNLVVGYKDTAIIGNINIDFAKGQFITLLGPNGAGKTTLLRTLSRHIEPLAGSITINGKPLADFRQAELARIMAVVLTDKVTPPLFSVFQFTALGRYPHTDFLGRLSEEDRQVIHRSLSAVNAEDLTNREFTSLSDGERQKVLVARALAQEPQILLLDEPTAHLDLKHRVEVMAILRNLCVTKGITVIASLHDVDIAAKVSDRVALIKNGGISHWGYPEEVLTTETVAQLYDFRSASFSSQLGSIELQGDGKRGKVFVVGGMGSGATIYRMLAKRGYAISTGVLHSNDLDCFVADSLGANCLSQPPGEIMDKDLLSKACRELDRCDLVIDTGCNVGSSYQSNFFLLRQAVTSGKKVFTLRPDRADFCDGENSTEIISVTSCSQLFEAMEQSR